jgi:hypothetical protein
MVLLYQANQVYQFRIGLLPPPGYSVLRPPVIGAATNPGNPGRLPDGVFVPVFAYEPVRRHRAVWEALLSIPRAVGGVVGRNPISIIIPCHRMLGKDGALTGYTGGLERKRRPLEIEGGTFR